MPARKNLKTMKFTNLMQTHWYVGISAGWRLYITTDTTALATGRKRSKELGTVSDLKCSKTNGATIKVSTSQGEFHLSPSLYEKHPSASASITKIMSKGSVTSQMRKYKFIHDTHITCCPFIYMTLTYGLVTYHSCHCQFMIR